jgi:hypothetical protein
MIFSYLLITQVTHVLTKLILNNIYLTLDYLDKSKFTQPNLKHIVLTLDYDLESV